AALLIGNDGNLLSIGGEPQHRLHEVGSKWAVNPGGSQHQTLIVVRQYSSFAGKFRCSIDGYRMSRIVLDVWIRFQPVEYIVGRKVNQRRPKRCSGLRNRRRPV